MSLVLDNVCPNCHAQPGRQCISTTTGVPMPLPHYNRYPALEVRCPACGAQPGENCTAVRQTKLAHYTRILAARDREENAG